MKKAKIVAALALSACMAVGATGLVACTGQAGKSAYEIWLEQGNEGTEKDFLNSLKGSSGSQGLPGEQGEAGNGWLYGQGTPEANKGSNGDMYLDLATGEVYTKENNAWEKSDLNIKGADGEDGQPGTPGSAGKSGTGWLFGSGEPSFSKGNEGDLYLDTATGDIYTKGSDEWKKSDLNIKGADGEDGKDGQPGTPGTNGATWIVKEGDPINAEGNVGDLWLDITTWNIYKKTAESTWTYQGCIKGKDGASGGSEADAPKLIKELGTITLRSEETKPLDYGDVPAGKYYLCAETESEAVPGGLFLTVGISGNILCDTVKYDMYMPISKTYKCFGIVRSDGKITKTEITNNSGAEMTVKLTLQEFSTIKIEPGKDIELPAELASYSEEADKIDVELDPSMWGKTYNVKGKIYRVPAILGTPSFSCRLTAGDGSIITADSGRGEGMLEFDFARQDPHLGAIKDIKFDTEDYRSFKFSCTSLPDNKTMAAANIIIRFDEVV